MVEFPTFKGSWPWPWPWIGLYCIPSCITRRPLPTYQISLKSKKLFCGWTYGRTDVRIGRRTFDSSGGVDLKINNKAVVDIRFRALCNSIIPFAANSPHRLRLKIFRILFVLAWYTELPGIPSVAWRYWRLNYPICSGATVKNERMLLISPDNPRELPLPLGGFAPPSKTWFLGPTQVFV